MHAREVPQFAMGSTFARRRAASPLPRQTELVWRFPNPSIREVEDGKAQGLVPLRRRPLEPGGVGLGGPSSGPAEMRGRQAVPLRRIGYGRIGAPEKSFPKS